MILMRNPEHPISILRRYLKERGGKIQWMICPTAPVEADPTKYRAPVEGLIQDGCEAIYLWGVHSDSLVSHGRIDRVARRSSCPKDTEHLPARGLIPGTSSWRARMLAATMRWTS